MGEKGVKEGKTVGDIQIVFSFLHVARQYYDKNAMRKFVKSNFECPLSSAFAIRNPFTTSFK